MVNKDFTYCPHCATRLRDRFISGQMRRACPNGDFIQFHDPKVAVIALVLQQNQILLAKRAVAPEKGKWALPGGYMDAGEMPDEALRRELMEEVNLPIDVQSLLTIYPISNPASEEENNDEKVMVKQGIVLVYQAVVVTEPPAILEANDDIDEARWFTVDSLPIEIAFESTRTLLGMWQRSELG